MLGQARPADLQRRLPWLLVFRAAVATAILVITLAADYADWPLRRISALLYAVCVGTYLVVLLVGLMLRLGVNVVFLCVVHVGMVILGAAVVVQGTGGVDSTFSFLYVLAILDAAIMGNMPVAMACAGCCSAIYGTQLIVQWNQFLPGLSFDPPEIAAFTNAAVSHVAAFFLSGWLAGHLAEQTYRARRDLMQAEHLYSVVLESLPVGVLAFDNDRVVRVANAAMGNILGQAPEAMLNQGPSETLSRLLREADATGMTAVEINNVRRYFAVSHAPLQGAEANDPSEVVLIDDRTKLRALEESLRSREKLASLGQLSAAMAHELRNPLAAISGCVEMSRGESSPVQRDKLAGIVLREIDRLNVLISDFLTYARPSPPERLPVDLCALTRDVCDFMHKDPKFIERSIHVDAPGRLVINADAGQLRRLLWNLLKNAFEASEADRPVEVRVAAGTVEGRVTLSVRDRGDGMSDSVRQHLFEPFQTTKEGGTGLGLAVVHSIVTAHQGVIDVESAPSSGTEMRVHLPTV